MHLRRTALALTALAAFAAAAPAQADKPGGSAERSADTPPVWAKPSADARRGLATASRASKEAVFLVGHPKVGTGTAWVVSKKHRLLVTNAHVADIYHDAGGKMFAIPNGTSNLYRVERVWYHPGVRRYLKQQPDESVRSTDPRDGEIDPHSPDLALLQLSSDGPDLPAEWAMATPAELEELVAEPAAIAGFPGHDTSDWPALGEKAAATYHDGMISRLTDFRMSPNATPGELQFLQYTMATWPGFSGSPVYLPNGHVIAVHNMARTVKARNGVVRSIPHGVRVDCVWEMLAYHNLLDKVPARIDASKLLVARWRNPDEHDERLRKKLSKVVNLVAEGSYLIYTKEEFIKGVDKCNEAIELMPKYALAYYVRAHGFVNFWFNNRRRLSPDEAWKMLKYAAESADKYCALAPADPDGLILQCLILNNAGHSSERHELNEKALEVLDKLLTSDNLPAYTRAEALSNRAIANDNIGDKQAALRDHNAAIRLNPTSPQLYENRADFWHYQGRPDLEAADYAKARELREKHTKGK